MIELLAVVALIGILTSLLLPALARGKAKARRLGCLNNLKQLALSVQIYAPDNDGKLPENLPGQLEGPGRSAWVYGNLQAPEDSTNRFLLQQGRLFPYVNQVGSYRCPADPSTTRGVPRVRSYSMNGWMGSRYMEQESRPAEFRTFVRESELAIAGPSRIWMLMDEHETSIDDGWFQVTMDDRAPFASFPANRHEGGYALNFGDGHVEAVLLRDPGSRLFGSKATHFSSKNADWIRLKQLTTSR